MDNTNGGWIKLYWKTKDSVAGTCTDSLAIWTYLLLSASRNGGYTRDGEKIPPGAVVTSQIRIARDLQTTRKVVRRWLQIFENEGMIESKRANAGTTFHIINWGVYQVSPPGEGQRGYNAGTTQGQRRDKSGPHTEIPRDKETKREREGARPQLENVREYARSAGLPDLGGAFCDHYAATGWKISGTPIEDWQAAYRRWCARESQYTGEPPKSDAQLARERQATAQRISAQREQYARDREAFVNGGGEKLADMLVNIKSNGAT